MNQKIIPVISIAIGIIAFFLTANYLQTKDQAYKAKLKKLNDSMQKVVVMVATRDIPKNSKIGADDIKRGREYKTAAKNAVMFGEGGEEAKRLLGKRTTERIKSGDVISWQDIEGGIPEALGLASMIKPGLRAVSIPVSGSAAVSSMVRPKDRIDILGTFTFPSKTKPDEMEVVTFTLLQDVTVLATGQDLANRRYFSERRNSTQRTNYSAVTLEVTPQESELLVFAQQMRGKLTLSLRHPTDNQYKADLDEVNFKYLQTELEKINKYRQTVIRKNNQPIR